MPHSVHVFESQRRDTRRVGKEPDEGKRFRDEYFKLFGGKEMKDLKKMLDDMEGNIERLQDEKIQMVEKNKRLEEEKEEKDNAVKKFSQRMEFQMADNKTNIGDFSDQNPLSTLEERYTMLYDNQWLHAVEVLTEKHGQNEETAIQILLNLLTECHNFTTMKANKQMYDLVERISGDPAIPVGDEAKRCLRTARKLVNVTRDGVLFRECENHIHDKMRSTKLYLYETEMKLYVIECFLLCWLLVIQDPPVVLGQKAIKGEDFDHRLYKYYRRSGTLIEFVVLPPLLLSEDGSLLVQGVAQPILRTEKQIAKYTWDEGGQTTHREQRTRTTMKPYRIEHKPVTPKVKADEIGRIRIDKLSHRLTTEHTEASASSFSTSSASQNTYASKSGNAQPVMNPTEDTDTSYQIQAVKASYTDTNYTWNQDQNATSRYEKSGDQIYDGTSGKTRSIHTIKQQDWMSEKSTNPPTSFKKIVTKHSNNQLLGTDLNLYESFVRILTESGEERARTIFHFSFEKYYAIYLADQVNYK
ncbi:hypothetical protein CHS0354_000003 [Potamilus streckersoni]|nr:hypothetical protein CHS0354_000003 [Potamilus streckersoni]